MVIVLIFVLSTVATATVITATNQTDSNSTNQALTDTNQVNSTNQTMDNQTRDALVENLTQKINELDTMTNGSNSSVIAEYSGQKLQELKSEVNNSSITSKTKKKLLLNINTALQANGVAVTSIVNGNYDQAQSELDYEYSLLDEINTQIASANGTTINTTEADNLTQSINEIKAGHENGAEWILNNDPDIQFNLTTQYYTNIEDKINEIRSIVSELQAGGVPVTIETKDTVFTTLRVMLTGSNDHDYAIETGGEIIDLPSKAMAALDGEGQIDIIEKRTGGTICDQCRGKIISFNLVSDAIIGAATGGLGDEAQIVIKFASVGLSIANAASEITDEQYIRTYNYIFNKWANGCSCEPDCGCIFRYTNLINLESKIKLLNNVYIHHAVPIEVTVTDSKYNGTGP